MPDMSDYVTKEEHNSAISAIDTNHKAMLALKADLTGAGGVVVDSELPPTVKNLYRAYDEGGFPRVALANQSCLYLAYSKGLLYYVNGGRYERISKPVITVASDSALPSESSSRIDADALYYAEISDTLHKFDGKNKVWKTVANGRSRDKGDLAVYRAPHIIVKQNGGLQESDIADLAFVGNGLYVGSSSVGTGMYQNCTYVYLVPIQIRGNEIYIIGSDVNLMKVDAEAEILVGKVELSSATDGADAMVEEARGKLAEYNATNGSEHLATTTIDLFSGKVLDVGDLYATFERVSDYTPVEGQSLLMTKDMEPVEASVGSVLESLDAHREDHNNPHAVTASQIGAQKNLGAYINKRTFADGEKILMWIPADGLDLGDNVRIYNADGKMIVDVVGTRLVLATTDDLAAKLDTTAYSKDMVGITRMIKANENAIADLAAKVDAANARLEAVA